MWTCTANQGSWFLMHSLVHVRHCFYKRWSSQCPLMYLFLATCSQSDQLAYNPAYTSFFLVISGQGFKARWRHESYKCRILCKWTSLKNLFWKCDFLITGTSTTPVFWDCCSEWRGWSTSVDADVKILLVFRWSPKVWFGCYFRYIFNLERWSCQD